ncbi:Transcription antitermination protein RfaH [Halomonadaceae bacterium LMG 33818]|uniref:transcriptional activator RfaH n=1 Tax=Cernens ardua TaxID=3402176 RepID=UPI003EDBE358
MSENYRWYTIQCKGRESVRAAENLHRQGYEIFHPLVANTEGRHTPLFPYYLFIRLNLIDSNWRPIRSTRGVLKVVRFGPQPTPVPDDFIVTLKEFAFQTEADPVNHYIRLKPSLKSVSPTDKKEYLAVLDKRTGDERVIALLNLIGEINSSKTR